MITDFESQLRDDLVRSSVQTDVPVDLDAVLDAGHRTLRTRTLRRASVGGAFVLALVVGGYGVSTLMSSSTIDPAMPRVTAAETILAFESSSGDRPASPDDFERVTVRANANGSFTFTPVTAGKSGVPITALPAAGSLGWFGDLGNGYSAGLIQGDVTWFDVTRPHTEEGGHGVLSAFQKVASTTWTAVVNRHDVVADVASITGIIWETTDGIVHSTRNEIVPSHTFDFTGDPGSILVYHEADLDTFGAVESGGGRMSTWPSVATDELLIASVRALAPDARTIVAGIIPAGATPPVEPVTGKTGTFEMHTATLPGMPDQVFVGVAPGQRTIHLTYVDADGTRHEIKP